MSRNEESDPQNPSDATRGSGASEDLAMTATHVRTDADKSPDSHPNGDSYGGDSTPILTDCAARAAPANQTDRVAGPTPADRAVQAERPVRDRARRPGRGRSSHGAAGVQVPADGVDQLRRAAADRPMPWPALADALIIRSTPDAFRVEEIPATLPDGSGEHLWVEIEKIDENSATVGDALAEALGVRGVDVGMAGRKDRHARTRQWFSVRVPAERTRADREATDDDAEAAEQRLVASVSAALASAFSGRVAVLQGRRHARKLQTGHLEGNRFEVAFTVCGAQGGATEVRENLLKRGERIRELGVPNYFGDQRFGQRNLETAVRLLRDPRARLGRTARSMAISALRAALFNAVLAARVRGECWNRLLPGDWVGLSGSESVFLHAAEESDDALQGRLASGDVHPTAPLCGQSRRGRDALASGDASEAAAFEARVLASFEWAVEGLRQLGVDASRRATRSWPTELELEWSGDGEATESLRGGLKCRLGPGVFVTTVLEAWAPLRTEPPETRGREVGHPSA